MIDNLEREKNTHLTLIIIAIILTPTYIVLSSLTGSAILSNSYSGYNNIEAVIMAAIGSPFILITDFITRFINSDSEDRKSFMSLILGLSASSVISSLIGYAIYNEFHKTEMKVGSTAAASAVGSAVLGIPFLCLTTCGTIAYLEMRNRSDTNIDEDTRRQLDAIDSSKRTLRGTIKNTLEAINASRITLEDNDLETTDVNKEFMSALEMAIDASRITLEDNDLETTDVEKQFLADLEMAREIEKSYSKV
jgi:hypothetical protein